MNDMYVINNDTNDMFQMMQKMCLVSEIFRFHSKTEEAQYKMFTYYYPFNKYIN